MSQKKLLCIALLILGKIALVQLKVCPDEYADTGQINALVVWNGNISNGDTLPYCHTWTNCTIAFRATSEHSPSMDIDGGCFAVSEMNGQFPGSLMNDTQHPYYNFKFHCRSIKHLRLVFSQTEYTKEYKLSSNVLCNGTLVTTAPDGTSSGSPSNTPSVTPPNSRTVVDHVAIAIGTTVTLAVALAVFIPLIVIAVVICLWRRKKTNSDDSASYSSGGNDTSSISERGNSMRRDVGDGEEETTHPLSVTATNGNGITKMVTGKGSSC